MFKSKTMWLGILVTSLGVIETNLPFLQNALGDYYGYAIMAVGIAIKVLRVVTTQPLSAK